MANTPREQVYEYVADLAEGEDVWCDWAAKVARTADGFCQFCGSTEHPPTAGRVRLIDAARSEAAERNARLFGTDPSWYGQ